MFRKTTALFLVLLFSSLAFAQTAAAPAKADVLRPPKGAKVAIVVFEDLQCPDCKRAHPLLKEAAKTYKVPIVQYDFPLPQHKWAQPAAVWGRYFDSKSKELGDAYRDFIYENQAQITPESFTSFVQKFAATQKIALPFVVDPKGQFAKKVADDRALGQRIGVAHTPTIYVVSNRATGEPFVEVVDRSKLFQLIEEMQRQSR
jgi:protein-disulfide isomerase